MAKATRNATNDHMLERTLLTRVRLRQLSAFVVVYEQRNILKAAKQLGLTQSTVSKSMSEMESNLEQKLFTRSPRGVSPTPAGDVLYRHAKVILNELRHAADDLQRVNTADSGQVVVGVVPTAMAVLSRAIAEFKQQRPGISVRVLYGPDEELMSRLSIGELDLVLGRLYDENRRSGLAHEPVYDDPPRLIVRNDHPALGRKRLRLADLMDHPWILPPPAAYMRRYHNLAFFNEGLGLPGDIVETLSINVYRSLLLSMPNIVSILSEHSLDYEMEWGLLKALSIKITTQFNPVGFTTRTGVALHPPADAFRQSVRDTASKITKGRNKAFRTGPKPVYSGI